VREPGGYLGGEETALLESLEGKRTEPRPKPPFPPQVGLFGCPTLINNLETLFLLPKLPTMIIKTLVFIQLVAILLAREYLNGALI